MVSQSPDIKELVAWVRVTLVNGYLSYRQCVLDELHEMDLDLHDVVIILMTSSNVRMDFAPGCFTFRGPTADGEAVAVVIAERKHADRVKLIKVWRER